jgi:hypothetical protein
MLFFLNMIFIMDLKLLKGVNYESIVREVILKSHFFDIDNKRLIIC